MCNCKMGIRWKFFLWLLEFESLNFFLLHLKLSFMEIVLHKLLLIIVVFHIFIFFIIIFREQHISELLYPCCSVLDDSIGCALWFASRGKGYVSVDDEIVSYQSPARVCYCIYLFYFFIFVLSVSYLMQQNLTQ